MKLYFLSVPTAGIAFGSSFGSSMMANGRRLPLILFSIIGAAGCFFSVWNNYLIMMLGKFFFGMGAGVLIAVAPRMLEETIPHELLDNGFGATTNIGVDSLSLTSTIFIMMMPRAGKGKKAEDALLTSHLF
jgi:MFS family permease